METLKRELLGHLRSLQDFDVETTPGFYISKEIYDLLVGDGLSEASADLIVSNIQIDLSGLSGDLDDHKEFLQELAALTAPILHKMWVKCNKIGERCAINSIKTFKVWLG